MKISRNILHEKEEIKEESDDKNRSFDISEGENFEVIESVERKMVEEVEYKNRMADLDVLKADIKNRRCDDKQSKTNSWISAMDIKSKMKDEITNMYQQQLKIFEAHYSMHFNQLHNNQKVDPFQNNLMSMLVKDIDQKFKGRLKKVTGKIYEWCPSLIFSYWEERYAILDCRKFKYFKNENDKLPLAILNFDLFEAEAKTQANELQFSLKLRG